ncbi:MAG: hypothetical protein Q9210_003055 [Variospora velana]
MAAAPSVADTHLDSTLLELSWALFAITFIVISLRFLSDSFLLHSFKLPSYLALCAFLLALASQVLIGLAVHYGLGEHIDSLDQREISLALTYIWQAQPLQLLANTTGKFAIAALLVTLHGPRFAKAKTIFIWTLVGFQTAFVAIGIVMIYTQCRPVAKLWRDSLPGTCDGRGRNQTFAYAQGGVASFVDLALAIYPIILFWDLRVKLFKKLVLGSVCAIIRTVNVSGLSHTHDVTHAVARLVIWNTTEMYLVLLAGSLPGLRPLFNKRIRVSSNRTSSYDYAPRQKHQENQNMILKLSSIPTGRSRAYASTGNHNQGGSTENILATMGHGGIVKTTEVNVNSGRNSVQAQTSRQRGDESQSIDFSDIEIARADV